MELEDERVPLVLYLRDFANKGVQNNIGKKVIDLIPGWNKVFGFVAIDASLEDLKEVIEALEALLEDDKCCENPAHKAAEIGALKLLQIFLHEGLIDFNTTSGSNKETPLHVACENGRTEIVKLIILASKEHGIDLNAKDELFGQTPFLLACYLGNTEIMKLFLDSSEEYDIDLTCSTKSTILHKSAFHLACKQGTIEPVELLINSSKRYKIDLNKTDYFGNTAFQEACDNTQFDENIEIVKLMLKSAKEYGIDINRQDRSVYSSSGRYDDSFHHVISKSNAELAKFMIENHKEFGLDITRKNLRGNTGLDLVKEQIETYGRMNFVEVKNMLELETKSNCCSIL